MTKKASYRFAGYTESWEEKKLGDFSDVTKLAGFEFTNHVKYSSAGSIIALRGLNIKNGNIILNDVKYIDESDFSKLHRSKLIINDIMFTYVGTVGELAIIEDNNKFYLAPNVSRIRILNDTYPYFLMQYMWRKSFYQSVIFPLIATSSQPALSMENIRKFNISLPSLPEQTAIGSFFQDIDQLISLQQRKLEVLKEQKKTYLKLLFPAKGQKRPEVRFAGFEGDWEEVKLGDATDISKGQQRGKQEIGSIRSEKNCYPVFNGGQNPSGYTDEFNRDSKIMVSEGGASAGYVNYYGDKYWSGGHNFTIDNLENDLFFLFACLQSHQQELYSFQVGSGLPNIQLGTIKTLIVFLPTLAEQTAIGTFFQSLDTQISQQTDRLAVLKEMKKNLLRKMFI